MNKCIEEVDEAIAILDQAIDDVTRGLISEETVATFEGW